MTEDFLRGGSVAAIAAMVRHEDAVKHTKMIKQGQASSLVPAEVIEVPGRKGD